MRWLATVVMVLWWSFAGAATITTVTIRDNAGVSTAQYPLTFGIVLKQGDAPQTVGIEIGGTPVTTQADIKTRYADGSVRHAVISAIVPVTANQDTTLSIVTAATSATSGEMDKTAILTTDVGATIALTGLSGSGYSGDLTANLRTAINGETSLNYWLQGSVCTEILIDQRLNNSLNATWEVRFYPGTPFIRISHAVENVEANYRGAVNYATAINQGDAVPVQVYSKAAFQHNAMSRWRKVFWLGSAPPEVEIRYDTDYLISTGHIPNYDTSLVPSETAIQGVYSAWQSANIDIMGNGLQATNFASGDEGAVLQNYAVLYLLTWDKRLREVVLGQGEVTASCPIHYREYDVAKSFYGHTLSIDDRPTVRTRESSTTNLPSPIGSMSTQWGVDQAHQWSYNYLPYLVTGERWFLDELYYWSSYNLTYQNPEYRLNELGILPTAAQIRGIAWAYRTMVQAASIAPDSDPEKAYFENKIGNNITQWITDSTTYPLRHMYSINDDTSGLTASATVGISPWMQDFLAVAMVHGGDLGYDASAVLSEFGKFIIGRFSNDDFNWFNGPSYRFPTQTSSGVVSSWSEASSLFSSQPTSYPNPDSPNSYRYKARAALAMLAGYPSGTEAYNWLDANVHSKELLATDPTWAILPSIPACTDTDADGYGSPASAACTYATLDCNDASAAIHPGASEICGDGIDQDCSGADLPCSTGRARLGAVGSPGVRAMRVEAPGPGVGVLKLN